MQDYENVDELDNYEADGLADEDEQIEELDPRARERAERAMKKREREEQRRTGRRGGALDSPIDDEPVCHPLHRQRCVSAIKLRA